MCKPIWCVTALVCLTLVAASPTAFATESHADLPTFRPHEIATGLRGGYQVVVTDLNRDGRPDVIAVATGLRELVWFENPGWERHVIASGLSALINVAATDLDSDGIPELALAHGFGTTPARSPGIVSLLVHGVDPEQPWTVRELDRVPTAHRLRWYQPDGLNEKWLINSPLVNAAARTPEDSLDTPIHFYRPPEFERETIPQMQRGVVHAVEPARLADRENVLLAASFLGVSSYRFAASGWTHARVVAGDPRPWPASGSSEAAFGRLGDERFLATIEPWHGNLAVVYRESKAWRQRDVLDASLTDGHALVVVDLDGDGRDEIVAGERAGDRSLRLYAASADGETWTRTLLDEGLMAASGCAAADLNADQRTDLVCIGSAMANLKWYENIGPR